MVYWLKYLLVASFLLLVPVTVHYVHKEPQQEQRHVDIQNKLTRAEMIEQQYQPLEDEEEIPVEYVQLVSPDYDVRVPVRYETSHDQMSTESKGAAASSAGGEYFGFNRTADAGYGGDNVPSEQSYSQPQQYEDQGQMPYYDPGYGQQSQSSGRSVAPRSATSQLDSSSGGGPASYSVPASKVQNSDYGYQNTQQGGAAQQAKGAAGPYVKPTNAQLKPAPAKAAQPVPPTGDQPIQQPIKYFWPKVATALGLGPLLAALYNWWNQPQAMQTASGDAKQEPSKSRIEELEEDVEGDDVSGEEGPASEGPSNFGVGALKRYARVLYPKTPPTAKGSSAAGSSQGVPKQPSGPAGEPVLQVAQVPQSTLSVPRAPLYAHLNLNTTLQRIASYFSNRRASAIDPSLVTVLPPLPQQSLSEAVVTHDVAPSSTSSVSLGLRYAAQGLRLGAIAAQLAPFLGTAFQAYQFDKTSDAGLLAGMKALQAHPLSSQLMLSDPGAVAVTSQQPALSDYHQALARWQAFGGSLASGKGPIRLVP